MRKLRSNFKKILKKEWGDNFFFLEISKIRERNFRILKIPDAVRNISRNFEAV